MLLSRLNALAQTQYDPYWSNVVLLFHAEGTDGSQTFIDSTGLNAMTAFTTARLSTAQAKFGASSYNSPDTNDFATWPAHARFDIGTQDFCIEGWARPNGAQSSYGAPLFSMFDGTVTNGFGLKVDTAAGGTSKILWWHNGFNLSVAGALTGLVWSHVAVTREGSTVRLFLNGTIVATGTSSTSISATGCTGRIGSEATGTTRFLGHFDEIRATIGVARYTNDFTIVNNPFPDRGP